MCQNIKHNNLFDAMMSKIPPEEKEVLRKFLVFEPSKRITVKEALKLPYFEELHLEED
jgi:serine/threonine protein kinase